MYINVIDVYFKEKTIGRIMVKTTLNLCFFEICHEYLCLLGSNIGKHVTFSPVRSKRRKLPVSLSHLQAHAAGPPCPSLRGRVMKSQRGYVKLTG